MKSMINESVYLLAANDWNRETFDELISLPYGTSYNAYLIKAKKNALIDTVDPRKTSELLKDLGDDTVDYIVANHAEQDHSGSLPVLIKKYPNAKIVTNALSKQILINLLNLPEDAFLIIRDNDTLDLGGKTLRFLLMPWVHWPETMITYLEEDKILFTCDLFGTHTTTNINDKNIRISESKRYYAEIMMPFRNLIKKHLEKISSLDLNIIAPSHGPIYNNPGDILSLYEKWTSETTDKEVIIIYISMHGTIEKTVSFIFDELIKAGIKTRVFKADSDIGEIATAVVNASDIVIATPTVLNGPHPKIAYIIALLNALNPKTKHISLINSFGWGDVSKAISDMITLKSKKSIISFRGLPKKEDIEKIRTLVKEISEDKI